MTPVNLEVAEFEPIDVDVCSRDWFAGGEKKTLAVKKISIKNIPAATEAYGRHIRKASGDIDFFKGALNLEDGRWKILQMAVNISTVSSLSKPCLAFILMIQYQEPGGHLVGRALKLRAACWFNSTSTYIVEKTGENLLGQLPYDETYRDPGKIPISPVMGQQIRLIILQYQDELARDTLRGLNEHIQGGLSKNFDVVYAVAFILLHICGLAIIHVPAQP